MSQNQGDIQERIAAARREAESLKEKIRAKKETSADTSCMSSFLAPPPIVDPTIRHQCAQWPPKNSSTCLAS
jgi:hypothetical protein